jgi:uncharacterized membrane protein
MDKVEEITATIELPKRSRLKFIDMARSIAILLMLEGHFIEMTFSNFSEMTQLVRLNGTSGNKIFDIWYFLKGFTAPLFFTVTGVVFIYLLSGNKEKGFFKNKRVKKGFKRALELLFWGYLLQFNMRSVPNYLEGKYTSWLGAFHVLQCIGFGIAFLLIIYGFFKLIKKGPLYIYYFIAATLVFMAYPFFKHLPSDVYFPENAPSFIQNMFKGKHTVFALIPWLAFTLYGGMVGSLLYTFHDYVKKTWFPLSFIILGIVLNIFGWTMCRSIDQLFKFLNIHEDLSFISNAWLYGRVGQVFIVLGILMFIEKILTIKDSVFLLVGQNTLPIYVIHVVILYSGIFGYGLDKVISHKLSGIQSVFGAVVFLSSFILFIKYLIPIENKLNLIKHKLFRKNI